MYTLKNKEENHKIVKSLQKEDRQNRIVKRTKEGKKGNQVAQVTAQIDMIVNISLSIC